MGIRKESHFHLCNTKLVDFVTQVLYSYMHKYTRVSACVCVFCTHTHTQILEETCQRPLGGYVVVEFTFYSQQTFALCVWMQRCFGSQNAQSLDLLNQL